MSEVQYEDKGNYHLLVPKVLSENELEALQPQVEKLLIDAQKNVVLSLQNIDTIFSIHLTAFIQLYKLLKSFNLSFVLVDISPSVLNVMQMTHLENLLSIYICLDDYEDSVDGSEGSSGKTAPLPFEYSEEEGLYHCSGHMAYGTDVRKLFSLVEGRKEIRFEMSQVGYVEGKVLELIAENQITLVNPGSVILEIIHELEYDSKIKIES